MFEFQPTLTGELVHVRPLRAADFVDLYAVAADPLLWAQHPQQDRHQQDVFRRFFLDALSSGGALAVVDAVDRRVIGTSRYHGHDPQRREIEIGWTFLARSHWGGAYNGELKRLMLRHAFRFVDTVVFLIGPTNLRSQRAVEKIGGVRAGTRPDASGSPSVVYRIASHDRPEAAP
ncbi:GNAT family N-acetyltransferase [Catellatospora sichuanensis]|uniref:GNAT family N-acetyltransferase n=1 Tax=Catellatospora sichuanensis TaxID=1969805 RepID=UPI0011841528|nr:GNAT family N-acetyltransferase [Catellatospora sichuanensis]